MITVINESRDAWGRRMRARLKAPDELDPLAGTIVIAHETLHQDADGRGRRYAKPRTIEFDVLADKRTFRLVAYRFADGTIEYIGGSSTPNATVLAQEQIPPKRPDADAKSTQRIIQRESIPAQRATVIDDDGTERVVIERVPRGY